MQTTIGFRYAFITGIAAVGAALALSGCGGTSTNTKTYAPDVASGPAIYGDAAVLANPSLTYPPAYLEVSGLANATATAAYITGVEAGGFKTVAGSAPNTSEVITNPDGVVSLPDGFSSGGQYIDKSLTTVLGAATPGASCTFNVNISNGQTASGTVLPIIPASVKLTSTDPQWTLGTLQLTFNTNFSYTGPLANSPYGTAPFTLPFTTSGLHPVTVTVSDTGGNTTSTTFQILVLAPGASELFAQAIQTTVPVVTKTGTTPAVYANIVAKDKVELTTPNGKTVLQTATADSDGTVIFIAPAGTYGLVDTTTAAAGVNVVPITLTANFVTDQYNDVRDASFGTVQLPQTAAALRRR
jgi:hypothetical protein